MTTMTDEEVRKVADAEPFDAYEAAVRVGQLKSEVEVMPSKLRPIGNALLEMAERVLKDRTENDSLQRTLASDLLAARAERDQWREAYDRTMDDVTALQAELARVREMVRKAYHALSPDRPTDTLAERMVQEVRAELEGEVLAFFPTEVPALQTTQEPKPTDGREYLICKYGGYYKPNRQGYTNDSAAAGRYTLAEAERETHPNGPDGPRDGMTYIHESALTKAGVKP